jgi:hypothetical protein
MEQSFTLPVEIFKGKTVPEKKWGALEHTLLQEHGLHLEWKRMGKQDILMLRLTRLKGSEPLRFATIVLQAADRNLDGFDITFEGRNMGLTYNARLSLVLTILKASRGLFISY